MFVRQIRRETKAYIVKNKEGWRPCGCGFDSHKQPNNIHNSILCVGSNIYYQKQYIYICKF